MFIKISWKNSKGEPKEALVESEKIQGFITEFVRREIQPDLMVVNQLK